MSGLFGAIKSGYARATEKVKERLGPKPKPLDEFTREVENKAKNATGLYTARDCLR